MIRSLISSALRHVEDAGQRLARNESPEMAALTLSIAAADLETALALCVAEPEPEEARAYALRDKHVVEMIGGSE